MRNHNIDGFQLFVGLLAVVTAPLMLAAGEPAGWSLLLLAAGIVVLVANVMVAFEIDYDIDGPRHVLAFLVAGLFLTIAVPYLTRAANDLPTFFPGHDGDSEHFRLTPGLLALAVGMIVLARAIAAAHPRRARA